MSDTTALEQAMSEYAQAIRGDWSDFDGRSERDIIDSWVTEIHSPDPEHTLEWWRGRLGICADGNGHWAGFRYGHCSKGECPIEWALEQKHQAEREANR